MSTRIQRDSAVLEWNNALGYTQFTFYRGALICQVHTGELLHVCNLGVTVYSPLDHFPFRATISKRPISLLVPQASRGRHRQTDRQIRRLNCSRPDIAISSDASAVPCSIHCLNSVFLVETFPNVNFNWF